MYFFQQAVDFAVIEVGMGGLLDATNVMSKPIVCAITSIGHDHQNILGKTLTEIATHKCGIIKYGWSFSATTQIRRRSGCHEPTS